MAMLNCRRVAVRAPDCLERELRVHVTTRAAGARWAAGVIVSATLALASAASAQQALPASTINVQALGPQVGDVVPAFSLPDSTGAVRTLQDIAGPRGTMLVFSRSADW